MTIATKNANALNTLLGNLEKYGAEVIQGPKDCAYGTQIKALAKEELSIRKAVRASKGLKLIGKYAAKRQNMQMVLQSKCLN